MCKFLLSLLPKVWDSRLNIEPCGQVAMGDPAFLSEEFISSAPEPDIVLVSTAGHAKNGALCLLQETVRPQVVTTFDLPVCQDMWTVYSGQGNQVTQDSVLLLKDSDHRVMRKADFHIEQHIYCMRRVKVKLSDPSTSQRLLAANEKRHVTSYATLDGHEVRNAEFD